MNQIRPIEAQSNQTNWIQVGPVRFLSLFDSVRFCQNQQKSIEPTDTHPYFETHSLTEKREESSPKYGKSRDY